MYIKKIVIEDYRIYYGKNELNFSKVKGKNVFIISGDNGFGKTTLLTSLVWCFYGKLLGEVDEKFREDIYEAGGYKKFATGNLNRLAKSNGSQSYRVTLSLADVSIPFLPCKELIISRTFNIHEGEDIVEIYIDGAENELTKKVGPEIFINDFILPKEIAKFFFFDAEKIVALAEINTIEEKRNLSKAYSEVLGFKKYEDLKNHLQELRIRFRRDSATEWDRKKFEKLHTDIERHKKLASEFTQQVSILEEEAISLKHNSEQYQEKLIREGTSMSVSQLNELKRAKNTLGEEIEVIKNKLKDLLDLAPFAIAGNKLLEVKNQLTDEVEHTQNTIDPSLLKRKAAEVKDRVINNIKGIELSKKQKLTLANIVSEAIQHHFSAKGRNKKEFNVLLRFSDEEKNDFDATYSNLQNAFGIVFRQLIKDNKVKRNAYFKILHQITNAETKESDLLVQEIRAKKDNIDSRIEEIQKELQKLNLEIGSLQKEITIKQKLVSELGKKVSLKEVDRKKDKTAERLILKLSEFIKKLKQEKKSALEESLKRELNTLMHKSNFISRVEVEVEEDIVDINLYNKRKELIVKDTLSKGEQQLYATALLKVLVDESNINFSVFIDSPLQKFDKTHSQNIISSFYPQISEQVVLFPLLEKELSEAEYNSLLPKINKVFAIRNIDEDRSTFEELDPKKLFKHQSKSNERVYAH